MFGCFFDCLFLGQDKIGADDVHQKLADKEIDGLSPQCLSDKTELFFFCFLFNMSHDIRTPMNALLGYNELMKKRLTDPKLLDYQEKIAQSGNLLLSIINNVLDMARIESGKVELDESYAKVTDILEKINGVFEVEAEKKDICYIHEIDVEHQHIMCDVTKQQEFIPLLFEAFARERNTTVGKIPGTGLGMSIVRKYVDMMGGMIDVKSELGKGTKFTVTLPFKIAGEITIGSGETRGVSEITDVMAKFQKEYPLVRYEIYTANADDIKERLDRGLVDFGLLMEPVDISRYNFLRLKQKERWGIVVRDDSPLAGKERVTAEDLLSVPLISVKRTLIKKELEGWFGELYDQVQIAAIYNLVNNGIEMVRSGIGALLCFPIQTLDPGLKFIPLYPQVETGSVLVWRKNQVLSQTAYRFLEEFKKCVTGISDDKN